MLDINVDADNRPFKRQRVEPQELKYLPLDILLLSLPHLLAHPPTHRQHTHSVFLSLFALRGYLAQPNLEPNLECRAWTELAEAGFRLGLNTPGIENEVEKAITKAVRPVYPQVTMHTRVYSRISQLMITHKVRISLVMPVLV